ncbi:hypothetical protein R69749_06195 [Paraburkholderia domus]|jgi:hypothetical protein|uniref:Uncharacterized protein n=1 Tax=Paraburkholderia domus TaxID=2793075 RepID=A0A9N8QYH9_9BURK|nr:hypothetical protein R70006_03965 [Paraburkholderia domus]CAE6870940.1 hypothetical protein R69749_06195 [Paraburkholderia domus]CAE6902937.1 hypothetical protein R70211_03406 [Paraburkholderia domus]CAE6904136.1 hypothetical protein R75471_03143 [Paraburkholderia domus]
MQDWTTDSHESFAQSMKSATELYAEQPKNLSGGT